MSLPYEDATSGERALNGRGHGPGTTTHGQASEARGFTRKYRAWCSMLGRIRDTKSPRSRWYRQVPIHGPWLFFEAFDADVPDPPTESHTLDRIRAELGYVPGNVRWATMKEQCRNRRSNRLVTINGRTQCLAAWAEESGIKEATLRYRIARNLPPFAPLDQRRQTVLERLRTDNLLPAPEGRDG